MRSPAAGRGASHGETLGSAHPRLDWLQFFRSGYWCCRSPQFRSHPAASHHLETPCRRWDCRASLACRVSDIPWPRGEQQEITRKNEDPANDFVTSNAIVRIRDRHTYLNTSGNDTQLLCNTNWVNMQYLRPQARSTLKTKTATAFGETNSVCNLKPESN